MKNIRFISLNVALFETNNLKLMNFLAKEKPDIVCLQEVTKKVDISTKDELISINSIDQATTKLPYSFFAPSWVIRDFKSHNFHGKKYFDVDFNGFLEVGNYIKSRYKIYKGQNVFLIDHFTYITDWVDSLKEEGRPVQVTDTIINGQKIRVLNYHGIWSRDKIGNKKTEVACKKIFKLASQVSYPVIICGDFNLFPDSYSMKILNDNFISLVDQYHIKTTRPVSNELSNKKRNVVDYVFISKGIKVKDFQVVDNNVSDHLPLIVDFSL